MSPTLPCLVLSPPCAREFRGMRFHQDTPANRSKITSKTPQPFPKIPGAKGIPPEQLRCSYIPRFHRRPPTPAGNDRQGSPGVHLEHAITGAAFRGCCDPRVINERRVISSDHRSVPHGAWPWGHRVVEGTGVQCPRELPPAFFSSPLHGNVGGKKGGKATFLGGLHFVIVFSGICPAQPKHSLPPPAPPPRQSNVQQNI